MKEILIPTDFSTGARNASQEAILLGKAFHANLHFLHILPNYDEKPLATRSTHAVMPNQHKGEAQQELNELISQAQAAGLKASPLLVLDKGNERIENYIRPLNIDLVVMGSHGVSGLRQFVMGSITKSVIRHSPVPVLIIKHPVNNELNLKNIVFASNFKIDATPAFEFVARFAIGVHATLHIVYINFLDNLKDKSSIDAFVLNLTKPYPGLSFTSTIAETNDEEWGIHEFAEKVGADMIALSTGEKTGFPLTHWVAEDMVKDEQIPVMAICTN
jgi:nucleotide-binding universal stress UspA family protein